MVATSEGGILSFLCYILLEFFKMRINHFHNNMATILHIKQY